MEWIFAALEARWKYYRECWNAGAGIMILVFGVLGGIGTIQANFFPEKNVAIIQWIPPFPLYIWLIGILCIALYIAIEGGFRNSRALTEQVTAMKTSIDEIHNKQRFIDKLSELRTYGLKQLFVREISTEEDLSQFITDYEAWGQEVLQYLNANFSKASGNEFLHLGSMNDASYPGVYNSKHNSLKLHLGKRLDIMQSIINRFSQ